MHPIVALGIADVMAHCPINLAANSGLDENRGVAFTLETTGVVESAHPKHAPVYREPAHLAAWLAGFWAGQDSIQEKEA